MAVVPRKNVMCKEQRKQNSEDRLQNQWKLRLMVNTGVINRIIIPPPY